MSLSLLQIDRPVELSAEYLTIRQTAARIGYSYWTLYHWIGDDKLTRDRGLRRNGRSIRIEWAVFKVCYDRGDFE